MMHLICWIICMMQKTKASRIKIAKEIIKLSPYIVDAHLLLISEEIKSIPQQIIACQDAIKLGEKFIGNRALKEFSGEMWMHIPARPTMRAIHMLAMLYRDNDQPKESVEAYERILSMNENDNQGVRYECLPLMISLGQIDKAKALYKKYKDDWMSMWQYMGALVNFQKDKPNKTTEKILLSAHEMNKNFAPYLIGSKKIPTGGASSYYSPGDKNEAIDFIEDVYNAYATVDGALDWVKNTLTSVIIKSIS